MIRRTLIVLLMFVLLPCGVFAAVRSAALDHALSTSGGEAVAAWVMFKDKPGGLVVDYLGLDWQEGILAAESDRRPVRTASAWQARQPLHERSIGRWGNYYDLAPDFFDALAEIDAELGRLTERPERAPGSE